MSGNPPVLTRDSMKSHVEAGRLVVGPHTYGAPQLRYWGSPGGFVCRIGDYTSIADNVQIFMGGYHRPDWVTMYPFPSFRQWGAPGNLGHAVGRGDVDIGADVWLSSHCTIMSGMKVGHGAVVAAQAVVTKDVPPYAMVAGNPARIVKYRFGQEIIDALLEIAWWDWPESRVKAYLPVMLSRGVQTFIDHVRANPWPPAGAGPPGGPTSAP